MGIRALTAQARSLELLKNQVCVRAGIGYAAALLLDFGLLLPADKTGYREPELGLVVECCWRLENEAHVIVGSGDEGETDDSGVLECVGKRITQIDVHRPSYMVQIFFGDGLSLWIFPDDSRDYTDDEEFPRSPWYIVGTHAPKDWES